MIIELGSVTERTQGPHTAVFENIDLAPGPYQPEE
jgi:hypothetical protein